MTRTPQQSEISLVQGMAGSAVISNAQVIDGTGAEAYPADIVVKNGVIAAIEAPRSVLDDGNRLWMDAEGAVVCPGFIDVHSHADNAPLLDNDDLTKVSQGITTEVTGNCGYSLAPVRPGSEDEFLADSKKLFHFDYSGWHSVEEWFSIIDERRSVVNICPLIGHGTLRLATIGAADKPASASDVQQMGRLLGEAITAGAFGLSTGLIYPPGFYSNTDELAQLAAHLPADRIYATHMRDESSRLLSSIEETLTIGRRSGCRVHISHLKAAGKPNWGGVARALEVLDDARESGMRVTQDIYPYSAASTSLSICLPPWVHDGGPEATLRTLHDSASVERIREQIEGSGDSTWENIIEGAGYDRIMVADTGSQRFEGLTLADIARQRKIDPVDALIAVLIEEKLEAKMIIFDMDENDVETALRSPHTMIGSDGLPPGGTGRQHPRLYGTFPRVLGRYVRERQVIGLSEAIRRMTSLPATIFGVPDRGTVSVGKVADLVCFDPDTIEHPGTFLDPGVPPVGVSWVMQAGYLAMNQGKWAGVRRGSRLIPG